MKGRVNLLEWLTHRKNSRKPGEGAPGADQVVDPAAAVDQVRRMIHSALKESGLSDKNKPFTCEASLTLRVRKNDGGQGGVKFSLCGIQGDAGAARKSGRTQTLTITFVPTDETVDTAGIDPGVDEFKNAFDELSKVVDTADIFGTIGAVIDIDFMLDNSLKVSIIAGCDIKDESTHHLSVKLSRSTPITAKPNSG
jgi:hypothetical protein